MNQKDLNYSSQLVDYLMKNLKKGYTKESLKWALVNQGHSQIEIDKAFKKAEEEMARRAPVLKTRPEITREIIHPDNTTLRKEYSPKKSFFKKLFG